MLKAQPKSPLRTDHADAIARFGYALEERGSSAATLHVYISAAEMFLRYLEDEMGLQVPLSEISKEHAREWLRSLREKGHKPAGLRTRYTRRPQVLCAGSGGR
jgi:site-specific recombinase XerD